MSCSGDCQRTSRGNPRAGMDAIDRGQQDQIDDLQRGQRLMRALLVINTLASLAQIAECYRIWTWGAR